MHELSLCENIINSVDKALEKNVDNNTVDKKSLIKVQVILGVLVGVDKSSLTFWFPIVAEKLGFSSLLLEIKDQPAEAKCDSCQAKFSMESLMDPCPECGSFKRDILTGMAFNIKSLEV